jgi:hypothetical protein
MGVWDDLAREMDAWGETARVATLWWRDDDAVRPTAALTRLQALADGHGLVPALAVVPRDAEPDLPGEALLQHGYAHTNHGIAKKAELGPDRAAETVAAELATGRLRLAALFAGRALPVLTPPWNRIAPAVVALLPGLGFRGLSTFKPRPARVAAAGVLQVNTHVDIIDWRSRAFAGDEAAVSALTAHLAARRNGAADADEPTGLLSHHLVHDAPSWRFLDRLFAATCRHAAISWLTPRAAFGLATP